ncbi:sex peptide receptor-like [Hyalella azteca]|uniref:Sex peptide receptor-like n=1 Tax=Hyalella azteca TaxID=294128 RepID=A0A8B7NCK6_HYAAZ|nr:sex peptide receptor-like [Hyalella azteca]
MEAIDVGINFSTGSNMSRNVSLEYSHNGCELLNLMEGSDLKVPLYGYAMPVLLITTTTANTLIVAVLSQRNMKTPSNTILMAISLADLFTLVVPSPVFFYMYTLGHYQKTLLTNSVACYAWTYLSDVLPTLFHTASIWLSLALAAQRYIYICHSPTAHVFCTQPRVVIIIISIFFAALIHQLPKFLDFSYELNPLVHGGTPVCYICTAKWVNEVGVAVYYPIYFWLRVIFVHLLPCALLLLFNWLLYQTVRQAQKSRNRLLQENRKSEYKKARERNCTTMMLLVVVSITTVTEIPLAILTFLHILTNSGVEVLSSEDYASIYKYIALSNFFIICSYPLNFAVYCSMSRQFRETFAVLFLNRLGSKRLAREDSSRYSTVNGHRTSETVL